MRTLKLKRLRVTLFVACVSYFSIGNLSQAQKLELVVETAHSERVESVAISPNGKLLASTGGNIILWEATNGRFIKQLGGEEHLSFVEFSPDGKILAGCHEDGEGKGRLELWGVNTGELIREWKGSFYGVNQIAFSPDSKLLATTYIDGTITIWDVEKGKLDQFRAHEKALSVKFSPDGKILASSGEDDQAPIKFWEVGSWKLLKSLKADFKGKLNISRVWSLEFSPDGRTLATSSFDGAVRIWDWQSGRVLQTIRGHVDLNRAIAFSPSGKLIATSGDGQIKLWDTSTGEFRIALGEKQIQDISVDPLGPLHVRVPDVVLSMKFAGDGSTLISGSTDWSAQDAGFRFWDTINGKPLKTVIGQKIVSITPTPRNVLLVNLGTSVKLLDLLSPQEFKTLKGHTDRILQVVSSPDGRRLATASADRTIKLWEGSTGKEIATLRGHSREVRAVAFSPSGTFLASDGDDFTIRLWDLTTKRQIKTIRRAVPRWEDESRALVFSPDEKVLASIAPSNVQLWEIASGRLLNKFTDQDNAPGWILRESRSCDCINGFEINEKKVNVSLEGLAIKVANNSDDSEIARIYFLSDEDWAVVASDGRFDASQDAQKSMHYVFGLETIKLEQLKERYYEPNLLQKILGLSKDPLRNVSTFENPKLNPDITFDQPVKGQSNFKIVLTNRGGGIGRIQVFVNNKEFLADARDEKLKANPNVAQARLNIDLSKATNAAPGQNNDVRIVAWNVENYISSRGSQIIWTAGGPTDRAPPEVYAVVAGISKYEGSQLNLNFAAKDAVDIANAIELGARRLFGADKVHLTLLTTAQDQRAIAPTKENFTRAFESARKAKPTDILIVYLAGHGVTLQRGSDTYCYLTQEARTTDTAALSDSEVRRRESITSEELVEWIKQIPANKQVIVLDTCAAGAAQAQFRLVDKREASGDAIRAIDRAKDRTGSYILMGSAADAVSYEASQYGQGLLTYALLKGVKGAALNNDEFVDVSKLFQYARGEVEQLAKNIGGIQRPIIFAPKDDSFEVGQLKTEDKEKIALASPKPIILRPRFLDAQTDDDTLDLMKALRARLRDESFVTGRGTKSSVLVFVDDEDFPGGIRPTGRYTIQGSDVTVTLRLRREGLEIGHAQIIGTKQDVDALAEKILTVVKDLIGRQ